MLCNLHIYYVERETAGGKVEEQFQKFFEVFDLGMARVANA